MPEMVFEYILKQYNIDPTEDLSIDQSIDFGSTAAAFSGGQGDFTVEFEPHATALEQKGDGYVVASLGEESGYVPYTAFSAKKSYLEAHPDTVQAFVNALQRGMEKVSQSTPEEIAKMIAPQFPETDEAVLTAIVRRYVEQDTWKTDLIFSEDAFVLLQDILEEGGELTNRVAYEDLVNTEFETPEKFSGAFALFYSCNVDKMCALRCSPDPIPNPVAGYPLLDLRDLLFRIGFGSFCHSGENQLVAVVAVI